VIFPILHAAGSFDFIGNLAVIFGLEYDMGCGLDDRRGYEISQANLESPSLNFRRSFHVPLNPNRQDRLLMVRLIRHGVANIARMLTPRNLFLPLSAFWGLYNPADARAKFLHWHFPGATRWQRAGTEMRIPAGKCVWHD
jgi:hypothetical protein